MDSAGLLHVTMIDSTNMVKTWHTVTWVEGSWGRKGEGGGGMLWGVYIQLGMCAYVSVHMSSALKQVCLCLCIFS